MILAIRLLGMFYCCGGMFFFGGMLDVGLLGLFSWGYLGVQDPVIAVNRTSPIISHSSNWVVLHWYHVLPKG